MSAPARISVVNRCLGSRSLRPVRMSLLWTLRLLLATDGLQAGAPRATRTTTKHEVRFDQDSDISSHANDEVIFAIPWSALQDASQMNHHATPSFDAQRSQNLTAIHEPRIHHFG